MPEAHWRCVYCGSSEVEVDFAELCGLAGIDHDDGDKPWPGQVEDMYGDGVVTSIWCRRIGEETTVVHTDLVPPKIEHLSSEMDFVLHERGELNPNATPPTEAEVDMAKVEEIRAWHRAIADLPVYEGEGSPPRREQLAREIQKLIEAGNVLHWHTRLSPVDVRLAKWKRTVETVEKLLPAEKAEAVRS